LSFFRNLKRRLPQEKKKKKLTNTNDSQTFVTEDVVLGDVTARPIGTTVSNPIILRQSVKTNFHYQIAIIKYLTSWKDREHVDGRRQYHLDSCKQQRYHTLFYRFRVKKEEEEGKKRKESWEKPI
jgi:hypothetical protein